MDKAYNHNDHEKSIYDLWEKSGAFKETSTGEPYTILMPPPNANASLHAGHAMYTVDDIVTRFKRMQGFSTLWIPGMDHAGFETQFVYEKHLSKEGKSRMDFDRQTLYDNIFKFVQDNSGQIYEQFKRLGFSADWDRSIFTLDPNVVTQVYQTFEKMHSDNYVYRDSYIVNYCTHCGTSLAELEVLHKEQTNSLYYVKYPLVDSDEFITVATVRPEPIFVDTHLAVNPNDKINKHLIGKKVRNPLTDQQMEIIADGYVDPEFGTGIVKLTPAHDPNDFQVAKKLNLPIIPAIDMNGRIKENGGKYAGMKVKVAREEVVKDLKEKNLIEKVDDNYTHSIIICYRCKRDLEPLTVPNWFIKVEDLKKQVINTIEKDSIKFYPKRFKKNMLSWLEIMHDWPISRQIVWGIRIPVWYEVDTNKNNLWVVWLDSDKKLNQGYVSEFLSQGVSLNEIKLGLQKVQAATGESQPKYVISSEQPENGNLYLPETDTFDTWFSSGQWPLVTLKENEYTSRFPTNFIGTLSDILKFWISRMIMFSIYLKHEIPFKDVYLWAMVADKTGVKMSKSKGNVVNPLDLVEKYGADALRFSLLYGTPAGSKVILAEEKVKGMRNFANKIWNMGRFMQMMFDEVGTKNVPHFTDNITFQETDKNMINKTQEIAIKITKHLEEYKFSMATEELYEFIWHEIADIYIEDVKKREDKTLGLSTLRYVYFTCLKLLHPFMPFVTECIWQELKDLRQDPKEILITSSWPTK